MTDDAQAPQDDGVAADGRLDAPANTLQDERDRYYDLLLRKTAEFDNYRKRTEKERREHTDRVTGDLLLELLPIIDDLERALKAEAGAEQADAYRVGVELIHKQLLDLLKRRGVRTVETVGEDFDPHLHQAVTAEARDGARDGEILEEFRRGYLISERLLRPAMVKVARS
jgi:molecular chaperone GrpE